MPAVARELDRIDVLFDLAIALPLLGLLAAVKLPEDAPAALDLVGWIPICLSIGFAGVWARSRRLGIPLPWGFVSRWTFVAVTVASACMLISGEGFGLAKLASEPLDLGVMAVGQMAFYVCPVGGIAGWLEMSKVKRRKYAWLVLAFGLFPFLLFMSLSLGRIVGWTAP